MKTLKNTGITLLLTLVATSSLLAQKPKLKHSKNEQANLAPASYYETPGQPDSYANLSHQKTGHNLDYLNIQQLPATALSGIFKKTATVPLPQPQAALPKTFGIMLYPVHKLMKMRLNVEKRAGEEVSIKLLDPQGHVIHEKWLGRLTLKYGCYFDFSVVEDGRYTIEIANDAEVVRREIDLTSVEVVEKPVQKLMAAN